MKSYKKIYENIKKEEKYICDNCYKNKKEYVNKARVSTIHPLTSLCEFCQINQTSWYIQIEINSKSTPCCQKEMKLKLFPDYESSGIWCFHCGCNLRIELCLPDELIDLCGVWNDLWDHQITDKFYNDDEYFIKIFMSTGKYLCELINKYCCCEFNYSEDQLRHDIIFDRQQSEWFLEYCKNKQENDND